MAAGIATSVLIIEDEPLIALDIESIVEELGHDVIGIARTCDEAIEAVKKRRPGLILADIHLADGSSGIDAINEIVKQCEVPAIFVTAYPERLLSGVRAEPTFLVTKPFLPESLRGIISQALFFQSKRGARPGLNVQERNPARGGDADAEPSRADFHCRLRHFNSKEER